MYETSKDTMCAAKAMGDTDSAPAAAGIAAASTCVVPLAPTMLALRTRRKPRRMAGNTKEVTFARAASIAIGSGLGAPRLALRTPREKGPQKNHNCAKMAA
mmetsp:Transcript_109794/g.291622  ORF Transcript_109794/g.291622 Transcript_109794/m.291622 type:complete len:101 (-) Transcript_109794:2-304(-)